MYALTIGGVHQNIWVVLRGGGAVCVDLWVGVVGFYTKNYVGTGEIP